jgi:competence protein ComEA
MPTPAERKALLFLAGVIVLGASVRVVRAARDDRPADVASRQALARQLAAVDSARAGHEPARRSVGKRTTKARDARRQTSRDASSASSRPVDLDIAGEAEIEALPRIGPVLARRIIEDREAHGAFGSIEGFERVRGVGPALAASLGARVTFSGTARPSNAVVDPRLRSVPPSSKSPRRERKN